MNDSNKLATRKSWLLALSALVTGVCLSLFREYSDTGKVRPSSFVIAAVVFCIGLGIAAIVFCYANWPEEGEKQ